MSINKVEDKPINPVTHCIGPKWPMTQMADDHCGQSQMANDRLLRPMMFSKVHPGQYIKSRIDA